MRPPFPDQRPASWQAHLDRNPAALPRPSVEVSPPRPAAPANAPKRAVCLPAETARHSAPQAKAARGFRRRNGAKHGSPRNHPALLQWPARTRRPRACCLPRRAARQCRQPCRVFGWKEGPAPECRPPRGNAQWWPPPAPRQCRYRCCWRRFSHSRHGKNHHHPAPTYVVPPRQA